MKPTTLGVFTDPETNEEFELHLEPDGHDSNVRNAPGDRRSRSQRAFSHFKNPGFALTRTSGRRMPAAREREPAQPRPRETAPERPASNVSNDGEYLSIKKDALVGLISIIGDGWASVLARPDIPQPTGDPKIDFTNSALHRDALALHDQNRDRIRAVAGLAERAARLLLS